jgi:hypothetical protein
VVVDTKNQLSFLIDIQEQLVEKVLNRLIINTTLNLVMMKMNLKVSQMKKRIINQNRNLSRLLVAEEVDLRRLTLSQMKSLRCKLILSRIRLKEEEER